ncbi:RNA polymerase sigma factor [Myxococcota bacterium]|nr:RNA polymerase sigma factor [Myxococcota bacterium]MBU1899274.1 RNA polymerase sigma factor [Myxococcota bacterium]
MEALLITVNPQAPELDLHEIYRAHFRHVWHTLRRLGVPARDLEDAAHDVFLIVHRRWADYDPSRPIKPWLTGIAWRVAADARKRAGFRREQLLGDDLISARACDGPLPDALTASRQARELVDRGLKALDMDKRVVFIMSEMDGHTGPEIAEALGVPLNTIYSRIRLARERFAAAVRRLGGAPP